MSAGLRPASVCLGLTEANLAVRPAREPARFATPPRIRGVQGICAGPQAPPFGLTKRQRWNRPRRGSPSMPSEQKNYPVDFVAACVGPEGRLA